MPVPTNPVAARLVTVIATLETELKAHKNSLAVIRLECRHEFPEKHDIMGDWCLHCGKWFDQDERLHAEARGPWR